MWSAMVCCRFSVTETQMVNQSNEHTTANNSTLGFSAKGRWTFAEGTGDTAYDSSGNHNDLVSSGRLAWVDAPIDGGAIALDGRVDFWGTALPVVATDADFSVAAWVRLDSDVIGGALVLPPNEYALTAVSQDSPTHSAFYLGLRSIPVDPEEPEGAADLRWNFTVSPVDGSETGPVDWQHAAAGAILDSSVLNQWVFLVGVYELSKGAARIYVPSCSDEGVALLPQEWPFWRAEGGFQVGRGLWLGRHVDHWPGSIGLVQVFDRALTADEAQALYASSRPTST